MPTITASTITLIPDETTLPSTRSARNEVRFHSANGTSTKPASEVSLNSRMVMKSWIARMKKAAMTMIHAITSTAISTKLSKKSIGPTSYFACSSKGHAASKPLPASRPRINRASGRSEEHTSELPELMSSSYSDCSLEKQNIYRTNKDTNS